MEPAYKVQILFTKKNFSSRQKKRCCARFGGGETHKSPHKIFEYDDDQRCSHRDNYFTYRYAKHYV